MTQRCIALLAEERQRLAGMDWAHGPGGHADAHGRNGLEMYWSPQVWGPNDIHTAEKWDHPRQGMRLPSSARTGRQPDATASCKCNPRHHTF